MQPFPTSVVANRSQDANRFGKGERSSGCLRVKDPASEGGPEERTILRRDPVFKAFQTIDYLATELTSDRVLRIRALARHLGVSPSSALRLIANMEEAGVLEKDRSGTGYIFTPFFVRIARRIGDSRTYMKVVHEALVELSRSTQETALFAEYDPVSGMMSFTQMVESIQPVRFVARLHDRMPVFIGASGLAVMTFLAGEEWDRAIEEAAQSIAASNSPWKDLEELKNAVAAARSSGYAMTSGHRVRDAMGIFAPVRDVRGEGMGTVGLIVPTQRFRKDVLAGLAASVMSASEDIERLLGAMGSTDSHSLHDPR